jgi:hypothetical protein
MEPPNLTTARFTSNTGGMRFLTFLSATIVLCLAISPAAANEPHAWILGVMAVGALFINPYFIAFIVALSVISAASTFHRDKRRREKKRQRLAATKSPNQADK